MDQPSSWLLRLHVETRAFHDDVDAPWNALLHPGVTRAEYLDRLVVTYGFEAPLEAALLYTPVLGSILDLRGRSRAGLIARDLLSLGMSATEIAKLPQCLIAPFSGPIEALGWWYVTERTTQLHERVRDHLRRWLPEVDDAWAYLSAYEGKVGARWRELGQVIDRVVHTDHQRSEMMFAAKSAFRRLYHWGGCDVLARGA